MFTVAELLHADRHGKANTYISSCECACEETTTFLLIDICGFLARTFYDQVHTVNFLNTASVLESFLIYERQRPIKLICEIVVVVFPKTFPLYVGCWREIVLPNFSYKHVILCRSNLNIFSVV